MHVCLRAGAHPSGLPFPALVFRAVLAKTAQGAVAEVRALAGTKEGLSKACVAAE